MNDMGQADLSIKKDLPKYNRKIYTIVSTIGYIKKGETTIPKGFPKQI